MKLYKIIDDSGVDYKLLSSFGLGKPQSWLGAIVAGDFHEHPYPHIIVEKPFGMAGTFTAPPQRFQEISIKNEQKNTMNHLNNLIKNIREDFESAIFEDFLQFIKEDEWQKRRIHVYYSLVYVSVFNESDEFLSVVDVERKVDEILKAEILRRFDYKIGNSFEWRGNTFEAKSFIMKEDGIFIKTDIGLSISTFSSELRKLKTLTEQLIKKYDDCNHIYYGGGVYDKKRINISNGILSFTRAGNQTRTEINLNTVKKNTLTENSYITSEGYELLFLKKT